MIARRLVVVAVVAVVALTAGCTRAHPDTPRDAATPAPFAIDADFPDRDVLKTEAGQDVVGDRLVFHSWDDQQISRGMDVAPLRWGPGAVSAGS